MNLIRGALVMSRNLCILKAKGYRYRGIYQLPVNSHGFAEI